MPQRTRSESAGVAKGEPCSRATSASAWDPMERASARLQLQQAELLSEVLGAKTARPLQCFLCWKWLETLCQTVRHVPWGMDVKPPTTIAAYV